MSAWMLSFLWWKPVCTKTEGIICSTQAIPHSLPACEHTVPSVWEAAWAAGCMAAAGTLLQSSLPTTLCGKLLPVVVPEEQKHPSSLLWDPNKPAIRTLRIRKWEEDRKLHFKALQLIFNSKASQFSKQFYASLWYSSTISWVLLCELVWLPYFIAALAKPNILSNLWVTDCNLQANALNKLALAPGQVFLNINHFPNIWYPLCFHLPIPFCSSFHSGWCPHSLTPAEALPWLPAVNSWQVPRVQTKLWLPPHHIVWIRVSTGLTLGTKEMLLTFLLLCCHCWNTTAASVPGVAGAPAFWPRFHLFLVCHPPLSTLLAWSLCSMCCAGINWVWLQHAEKCSPRSPGFRHMGSFPVSVASAVSRQERKMLLQHWNYVLAWKREKFPLMKLMFTLVGSLGERLLSFHMLQPCLLWDKPSCYC